MCPQHRPAVALDAHGYDAVREVPPLPGPKVSHFQCVIQRPQLSFLPLSRVGSARVRRLDSQGLNVRQILLSAASPFIPERKKSWKSRGSGIIGVRSLTQQFHSFKAFRHRLSAPEPHTAPAVMEIDHRDLRPIDARIPGEWRYHGIASGIEQFNSVEALSDTHHVVGER